MHWAKWQDGNHISSMMGYHGNSEKYDLPPFYILGYVMVDKI